jgi:cytoskeleton protein RodZ
MSEGPVPGGAGALLREARERQGLHIAALAATLKVTPRKLEALEADRHDELPDAAFARALASSVCRTLKIDPSPVLERLPAAPATGLSRSTSGLNQPFRDRGRSSDAAPASPRRSPLLWSGVLLVLLAAVLWSLPEGWQSTWWPARSPAPASAPAIATIELPPPASAAASMAGPAGAAESASAAGTGASAAVPAAPAASVAAAPAVDVVHAGPEAGASAVPAGFAVLRVSEPSWIEAVDAGGQVLLQRTLQPGEAVGLDGIPPVRLRIGNAAGTQLSVRGVAVDLAPITRDNIARLELK